MLLLSLLLLLLLAVASGGSTMTAPVVIELSFPFVCPHVALKSNAGCVDVTTRGTHEIDGGQWWLM